MFMFAQRSCKSCNFYDSFDFYKMGANVKNYIKLIKYLHTSQLIFDYISDSYSLYFIFDRLNLNL